jgi:hypothetical protein
MDCARMGRRHVALPLAPADAQGLRSMFPHWSLDCAHQPIFICFKTRMSWIAPAWDAAVAQQHLPLTPADAQRDLRSMCVPSLVTGRSYIHLQNPTVSWLRPHGTPPRRAASASSTSRRSRDLRSFPHWSPGLCTQPIFICFQNPPA